MFANEYYQANETSYDRDTGTYINLIRRFYLMPKTFPWLPKSQAADEHMESKVYKNSMSSSDGMDHSKLFIKHDINLINEIIFLSSRSFFCPLFVNDAI